MCSTDKIYCKKCKDVFDITHFNTYKYNKKRGVKHTCKKYPRKKSNYTSKYKYEIGSYEYERDVSLKRMYGFSLEGFFELLNKQNNCCDICKKEYTKDLKFVVDHCHYTGTVRSILCTQCNSGIGKLLDNVELLKSALSYLGNPTTKLYPNVLIGYPNGKPKRIPDGSLDEITARRRRRLWREYKMSLIDYKNLLEIQNYKCVICNLNQDELISKLNVDHCHTTGKVRGLLCTTCNSAIGMLKDDPNLIKNAIKYLEKHVSL